MENKNMKRLLNYVKENDIIKKYQLAFDKYFNFESLLLIDDDDVDKIICDNEYYSIANLYEIITGININDDIMKYICSLEENEVIKYCLRLPVSQEFINEEKNLNILKHLVQVIVILLDMHMELRLLNFILIVKMDFLM